VVWSKAERDGPEHTDFTPYHDVRIAASDADAYDRPVVVLTSRATFSAGETFVLAMRERDHVTVLGEPTSGHFSDLFDGELPRRWTFTYSGQRYRAADGEIYEARGVPVDAAVAFDADAFAEGRDVMLEAALARLGG
jgi:carboxyl-terminal processing protease